VPLMASLDVQVEDAESALSFVNELIYAFQDAKGVIAFTQVGNGHCLRTGREQLCRHDRPTDGIALSTGLAPGES